MTSNEKQQLLDRLQRASQLERTMEIATDALTAISNPNIEREISTETTARNIWYAIKEMPNKYRDAIIDVVKEWGEQVNEEYKKL